MACGGTCNNHFFKFREAGLWVIPSLFDFASINHKDDIVDGDTGLFTGKLDIRDNWNGTIQYLSYIGSDYNLPFVGGLEHQSLFVAGEVGVEREDDTRTNKSGLKGIYTLSNLRYSGHEDENRARPLVFCDMGDNCGH